MVKVSDPREDRPGTIFRASRADKVGKSIKKTVNKSKSKYGYLTFNEDNLGLQKIDVEFYNEFKSCPDDIKKEFIFLWEEISDLTELLDFYINEKKLAK